MEMIVKNYTSSGEEEPLNLSLSGQVPPARDQRPTNAVVEEKIQTSAGVDHPVVINDKQTDNFGGESCKRRHRSSSSSTGTSHHRRHRHKSRKRHRSRNRRSHRNHSRSHGSRSRGRSSGRRSKSHEERQGKRSPSRGRSRKRSPAVEYIRRRRSSPSPPHWRQRGADRDGNNLHEDSSRRPRRDYEWTERQPILALPAPPPLSQTFNSQPGNLDFKRETTVHKTQHKPQQGLTRWSIKQEVDAVDQRTAAFLQQSLYEHRPPHFETTRELHAILRTCPVEACRDPKPSRELKRFSNRQEAKRHLAAVHCLQYCLFCLRTIPFGSGQAHFNRYHTPPNVAQGTKARSRCPLSRRCQKTFTFDGIATHLTANHFRKEEGREEMMKEIALAAGAIMADANASRK